MSTPRVHDGVCMRSVLRLIPGPLSLVSPTETIFRRVCVSFPFFLFDCALSLVSFSPPFRSIFPLTSGNLRTALRFVIEDA